MLHLWWVNEDSGIVYDNPRKGQVLIKGMWKSEWFDSAAAGIAAAQKITKEKISEKKESLYTIFSSKINSLCGHIMNTLASPQST